MVDPTPAAKTPFLSSKNYTQITSVDNAQGSLWTKIDDKEKPGNPRVIGYVDLTAPPDNSPIEKTLHWGEPIQSQKLKITIPTRSENLELTVQDGNGDEQIFKLPSFKSEDEIPEFLDLEFYKKEGDTHWQVKLDRKDPNKSIVYQYETPDNIGKSKHGAAVHFAKYMEAFGKLNESPVGEIKKTPDNTPKGQAEVEEEEKPDAQGRSPDQNNAGNADARVQIRINNASPIAKKAGADPDEEKQKNLNKGMEIKSPINGKKPIEEDDDDGDVQVDVDANVAANEKDKAPEEENDKQNKAYNFFDPIKDGFNKAGELGGRIAGNVIGGITGLGNQLAAMMNWWQGGDKADGAQQKDENGNSNDPARHDQHNDEPKDAEGNRGMSPNPEPNSPNNPNNPNNPNSNADGSPKGNDGNDDAGTPNGANEAPGDRQGDNTPNPPLSPGNVQPTGEPNGGSNTPDDDLDGAPQPNQADENSPLNGNKDSGREPNGASGDEAARQNPQPNTTNNNSNTDDSPLRDNEKGKTEDPKSPVNQSAAGQPGITPQGKTPSSQSASEHGGLNDKPTDETEGAPNAVPNERPTPKAAGRAAQKSERSPQTLSSANLSPALQQKLKSLEKRAEDRWAYTATRPTHFPDITRQEFNEKILKPALQEMAQFLIKQPPITPKTSINKNLANGANSKLINTRERQNNAKFDDLLDKNYLSVIKALNGVTEKK